MSQQEGRSSGWTLLSPDPGPEGAAAQVRGCREQAPSIITLYFFLFFLSRPSSGS